LLGRSSNEVRHGLDRGGHRGSRRSHGAIEEMTDPSCVAPELRSRWKRATHQVVDLALIDASGHRRRARTDTRPRQSTCLHHAWSRTP
jgi:hypothetical protein